ncbi:hypothetical protein IE81DRAFT_363381 [Ceraceosorus guamensis]|uniref:Uncharacterized protein n=1 Tax=Ceraceosorus guamensis TaxID=1522189 RepID=A0A316WCR9_9BASI|nr:hypothetical protein IE81DRAFT_363381 [Ceraceosorus guamensis]PWN46401.1 hypothetical protein IE81DRAFT_363381 [Ceraceosorus guamensis]
MSNTQASGSGCSSASRNRYGGGVTTFIPASALHEDERGGTSNEQAKAGTEGEDGARASIAGRRGGGTDEVDVAGSFAGRAASIVDHRLQTWLTPHAARGWKRAFGNLLGSWDGLEAVMHLGEAALLLVYSLLSSPKRKLSAVSPLLLFMIFRSSTRRQALQRLLATSEFLSGAQTLLTLSRFTYAAFRTMVDFTKFQFPLFHGRRRDRTGVIINSTEKWTDLRKDDQLNHPDEAHATGRNAQLAKLYYNLYQSFHLLAQHSAELMIITGETLELASYLGHMHKGFMVGEKNSLRYRIVSGFGLRSRTKTERIGLILGFSGRVLLLLEMHFRLRHIRNSLLRRANARLIAATDLLNSTGDARDSARLLGGRRMEVHEAMAARERGAAHRRPVEPQHDVHGTEDCASESSGSSTAQPEDTADRQTTFHSKDLALLSKTKSAEQLLRKEEINIRDFKREISALKMEKWALRAEALSGYLQIWLPDRDNTRTEAVCELFAALLEANKVAKDL